MTGERRLHQILLLLALALCLVHFAFLGADFPNHSQWSIDQAKYTDEGWWASAAVRQVLVGHWQVAGDYNPAVAVPMWPVILTALFRATGVSIIATRALNVFFFVATVGLAYLLGRRYADQTTAALAALLLAASPFAFVFSRLATLDTIINFEFALLLWVASLAKPQRNVPSLMLGVLIALMLLTKTTALVLVPAVLWVLWTATRPRGLRALLVAAATACAILVLYLTIVLRSQYAQDYHYFFAINALADLDWRHTLTALPLQLLRHGMWVDRILYPTGLVVLVFAMVWSRRLWGNPLFTASWIALAGEAIYILRRQDDYAPRYFLPMLAPLIFIVVMALHQLSGRKRVLLAITLAVAVMFDSTEVLGFLIHRQYQFDDAATSIRAKVDGDPRAHRLLLGSSGPQLSLMIGIPSINDGYSSQDLAGRVARDLPGWYVGWNDLDEDILDSLSAFHLEKVASYRVFDHDDRDMLNLYRMVEVHNP